MDYVMHPCSFSNGGTINLILTLTLSDHKQEKILRTPDVTWQWRLPRSPAFGDRVNNLSSALTASCTTWVVGAVFWCGAAAASNRWSGVTGNQRATPAPCDSWRMAAARSIRDPAQDEILAFRSLRRIVKCDDHQNGRRRRSVSQSIVNVVQSITTS